MLSAEVVIVGAGPAGSALALLLARRGYDVMLLDQACFPRDKPCGEYLNPAAVAALERLGMAGALRAAGAREVVGACLSSPSGRELRVRYPSAGSGVSPRGLSMPRMVLDDLLLRAAESAGVQVQEQFRVDDLLFSVRRVNGIVGRAPGGGRAVRAQIVVGADGSRSVVARRLGLARPASAPRRFGLVAHYEGVDGDDWVEMHAGRRGYCGLGYSAGAGANVALVAEPSDLPHLRGRPEAFFAERLTLFPAVARRLAGGRRLGRVMVTGSMSSRAAAVHHPGLLLVGDAAGFYDPFTGEGISYALRGAELAAAAICAVLGPQVANASDTCCAVPPANAAEAHSAYEDREVACFCEYARRRDAEFASRLWLSRAIQSVLRHPWLLEAVFRRFEAAPALLQQLIGVTAGVLPPPAVLSTRYLASLVGPQAAGSRRETHWGEPATRPLASNVRRSP